MAENRVAKRIGQAAGHGSYESCIFVYIHI